MSVLATLHTVCGCTREQWVPAPPPWQFKVPCLVDRLQGSWEEDKCPSYPNVMIRVFERRGDWTRATEHRHAHCDYYEVVS